MKTWTDNFTAKVEKREGEQSCKLVHINYGSSSHLYLTDADQEISLGGNTYYPYIKTIGRLSFEMMEEDTISSVANVDIEIMRNATTDVLLSNLTKNRTVEIWQYFIGLDDADKLPLANMVVDYIDDVIQGTFILKLKAKEVLLNEVPVNRFNETDYPSIVTDNLDLGIPIVLGKLEGNDPVANRLRSYKCRAAPCFCIDRYDRKFLGHKLTGHTIQGQGSNEAAKFESQWNMYSFLVADTSDNRVYDFYNTAGEVRVDLHTDFAAYQGNRRRLKLMPTKEGNGNTVTDWKDCVDFDGDTVTTVSSGLSLKLSFPNMAGFIANSDIVEKYIKFTINSISGTLSIFYGIEGGSEYSAGTETTTGTKSRTPTNWNFDNNPIEDCYIRFTCTGTCDLIDVYLDVVFVDRDVVEEGYVINRPRSGVEESEGKIERRSRFGEPYTPPAKAGIAVGKIFCEIYGINDTINPGSYSYLYYHPVYIIYAMLNFLCGYPTSDIDTTSFDDAYDWLGTLYHDSGNQIQELRNVMDYLREILFESQLKLFMASNGKFKLFKLNKAETTKTTFRDLDMKDALTSPTMVYQMTDFKFYQSSTYYNKFIVNYYYDFGNASYGFQIIEDRTTDANLNTSYSNYNNIEKTMEVNCNWLYLAAHVQVLTDALIKYWKQTKLIVEFDTNLVGTNLELGDTIRTNHKAQIWNSDAKDFQVIGLEQDGDVVHVKGIEIIT